MTVLKHPFTDLNIKDKEICIKYKKKSLTLHVIGPLEFTDYKKKLKHAM